MGHQLQGSVLRTSTLLGTVRGNSHSLRRGSTAPTKFGSLTTSRCSSSRLKRLSCSTGHTLLGAPNAQLHLSAPSTRTFGFITRIPCTNSSPSRRSGMPKRVKPTRNASSDARDSAQRASTRAVPAPSAAPANDNIYTLTYYLKR